MAFRTLKKDEVLNNALVVDNSVMMRWLFQDGSESEQIYAQGVLQAIGSHKLQVIVPYIWVYESAFVVEFYAKQKAKKNNECMENLTWLFDLSTVIRGEERPSSLYEFSHLHRLSAYDAAYIMLALNQSCPIATLDKSIAKASRKTKHILFEIE